MSIANLFAGTSSRTIDVDFLTADNLTATKSIMKSGDKTYTNTIDRLGHLHLTSDNGTKLLSFSDTDTLNDCVVRQHVLGTVNNAVLGLNAPTQTDMANLRAQLNALQNSVIALTQIVATLSATKLNATDFTDRVHIEKPFFQSIKESIFLQDASGNELDYTGLI